MGMLGPLLIMSICCCASPCCMPAPPHGYMMLVVGSFRIRPLLPELYSLNLRFFQL